MSNLLTNVNRKGNNNVFFGDNLFFDLISRKCRLTVTFINRTLIYWNFGHFCLKSGVHVLLANIYTVHDVCGG